MGSECVRYFHYPTGDVIKLGDVLLTGFLAASGKRRIGRIVNIVQPQSQDAMDHDCGDDGGVLIDVDWDGEKCLVLETPPDGSQWEDLELIRRA